MRTGIDRNTGRVLTGWDHTAQSLMDIVQTAVGSRVLRRDCGFNGPAAIDAPMTERVLVAHFSALADAIRKWEPNFRLRRVQATQLGADGVAAFALTGDYYPNGYLGDWSVAIPMQQVTAAVSAAALAGAI